jgi:hypothetical protein
LWCKLRSAGRRRFKADSTLGSFDMQAWKEQPVYAANLKRDVMADNVGDVGRHRTLLDGKVDDPTLLPRHTHVSVPTSVPFDAQ